MSRYAVIFSDGSMSVMPEARSAREMSASRAMAIEERDGWNERERATRTTAFARLAMIEVASVRELTAPPESKRKARR